ncbi:MAG: Nudix family hydrolase [Methylococcaceae bacterium]|nr:Nudix family hydrolase [Methylococcaceae bacterium]
MNLETPFLHVAVGVIKNSENRILIAKRADKAHQGGLWEFSGGKVEADENVFEALKRELAEELAITINSANPLIQIRHHYQDLSVLLDVWEVTDFTGTAHGKEGQPIKWVALENLADYQFPAANKAIIKAAQLPRCYAILDDANKTALLPNLQKILNNRVKLIQARLKNLDAVEVEQFLAQALPLCKQHQAKLLINSGVIHAAKIKADGLHLTSADLMKLEKRSAIQGLLAASCHNLQQLQHAEKIGVDFAVLAPILPTLTHPNAKTLGWQLMSELIEQVNIPVFALGGIVMNDMPQVQFSGAQGIAGIRAFLTTELKLDVI